MVSFIPIERRMLIRWCWNAEAVEFATEERSSGRICHGRTRNFTESKITHIIQSRMRERRLLPCAGVYNFLLHIFTSLKRKRRFLKEAKHFYREDAKTAKRQKGRSKKHFSHGRTRNFTESKITHIFQSRMRERRFFLAQANTTFYCISLQA